MNIWIDELWRAWRASLRRPGFLVLASSVLALGIGASAAVFALIDATLLRPLPVPEASRLMAMGRLSGDHVRFISLLQYGHLGPLDGVESVGLYQAGVSANITEAGAAEQVPAIRVDRGMLPSMGLHVAVGRDFSADEDRPDGPAAVLLSDGFWKRHYDRNPAVVGQSLSIESVPHTIVGVLPAAFTDVAGAADLVLPLAVPSDSRADASNYLAVARLADGAVRAQVGAQIDTRLKAMYRSMGEGNLQDERFGLQEFTAWKHQGARSTLMLFLASGCAVLLIALVNLTNLMLLRSLARRHDVAVRRALGASLLRLMLPSLGEGLLVGTGGALLGMVLAVVGLAALQAFIPAEWLPDGVLRLGAATWLLAFAAGWGGALLAAALAVARSRSQGTLEALRDGGRGGIGLRDGRLGRALVVAQVGLAVLLLSAAGIFMHALYDASRLPLGIDDGNILTFDLSPVRGDYPDAAAVGALSQRLVQRLRDIPGVTGAAVTTNLPSSQGIFGQLNINIEMPGGGSLNVQYHAVDPGFFRLFGLQSREGRGFTRDDLRGSEPVAVVSRNLADRIDGGHALGQRVLVEGGGQTRWPARIVGVVDDTYQYGPLQPKQPVLYVPLTQMPEPLLTLFRDFEPLRFAVRGRGNPADWAATVRAAVTEIAPRQPIAHLRSMRSIVHETTQDARLSLWLIGLFAVLALLLAAAGMYAVMAVAVAAREREFGVRTALGAPPSQLMLHVLRGGLRQILVGLLLGVIATALVARWLGTLLMQLAGRAGGLDPLVLAGVSMLLLAAGLVACLWPALRASRVHPMRALRADP